MNPGPVTLTGEAVRLEPLSPAHEEGLTDVGLEPSLWAFTTVRVTSSEEMRGYIDAALAQQAAATSIPFATVERATGRIVGSTRFMNIDLSSRRAEIGSTWVAAAWQRTAINTEAKYLMLRHAFENWNLVRVELKTDALNQRSRAAILRIGAKEEGTLRKHLACWDGRIRDTVYFSILDTEWPTVKQNLERRLSKK